MLQPPSPSFFPASPSPSTARTARHRQPQPPNQPKPISSSLLHRSTPSPPDGTAAPLSRANPSPATAAQKIARTAAPPTARTPAPTTTARSQASGSTRNRTQSRQPGRRRSSTKPHRSPLPNSPPLLTSSTSPLRRPLTSNTSPPTPPPPTAWPPQLPASTARAHRCWKPPKLKSQKSRKL